MSGSGNDKRANVESVERISSGFLKIDKAVVTVLRHDGTQHTIIRESMERGDSAAILPIDRLNRKVWLVRQFRYPTLKKSSGWIDEVPAGVVDAGESFAEAAKRELLEETGFVPSPEHPQAKVEVSEEVATFYVSPGGTSERIGLFLGFVDGMVPDAKVARRLQDADEDIELVQIDIDAFVASALAGEFDDAKTLIAALWLAANRERFSFI